MRVKDETDVVVDDEEIIADHADDEFSEYFEGTKTPKIIITTRPRPSRILHLFINELMLMIPNSYYYRRRNYTLQEISKYAMEESFTHLIVVHETNKKLDGMIISHIGVGPTAYFRITSFKDPSKIPNHGNPTEHLPEIICTNFVTRLGDRVSRFLGSLFPHNPEFEGRRVVTFHNQRDFIFVRHHRYIFENQKKARLQELGPQFTMKFKWLQTGYMDMINGEYEWVLGQCEKQKRMIDGYDATKKKYAL